MWYHKRSTWVHPRLLLGFFSFICMCCRSLFVLLYFFFWPLSCLFFFDIRILITPLVSSNSSYILKMFFFCIINICMFTDIRKKTKQKQPPRYSWNIATVGVKHQSTNEEKNQYNCRLKGNTYFCIYIFTYCWRAHGWWTFSQRSKIMFLCISTCVCHLEIHIKCVLHSPNNLSIHSTRYYILLSFLQCLKRVSWRVPQHTYVTNRCHLGLPYICDPFTRFVLLMNIYWYISILWKEYLY